MKKENFLEIAEQTIDTLIEKGDESKDSYFTIFTSDAEGGQGLVIKKSIDIDRLTEILVHLYNEDKDFKTVVKALVLTDLSK